MAIDKLALAKLIDADRTRLGRREWPQKRYGEELLGGISQTRVSELETGQWKRALSFDLVEALRKQLGELPLLAEPTPAREMHNAPATVRNSEPRWYPMTAEEETVIFPLVRAVQELYRHRSADLFAHLLDQVGFLFDNTDKRANPQIAIALDAFEAIQKRAKLRPDTGERRSEPNRRAPVTTKRGGK